MSRYQEVWDKMLPLLLGTRIRYVKNECKLEFKETEWFRAREQAIGARGRITEILSSENLLHSQYTQYFHCLGNKNVYVIHFDNPPVPNYDQYYCLRNELEVCEEG